jgi:hypothetical protein
MGPLVDNVVDAAEKYFHLSTSTYKTDSNGYVICSTEKPKITNDDLSRANAARRVQRVPALRTQSLTEARPKA